jgi:hypothetical protein
MSQDVVSDRTTRRQSLALIIGLVIFAALVSHILSSAFSHQGFLQLLLSNTWLGYLHLLIMTAFTWLCVALLRGNTRYTEQLLANLRKKVNEDFYQISLDADIPKYSFSGKTAEIVSDHEALKVTNGIVFGLTLTRFARNSYGEYFFYMADGESMKLFKHVEHNSARAILKDKYVAPPTAA